MTEPITQNTAITTTDLVNYIGSPKFETALNETDLSENNDYYSDQYFEIENQFTENPPELMGQCKVVSGKVPTTETWQQLYPECYNRLKQIPGWETPAPPQATTQTTHTLFDRTRLIDADQPNALTPPQELSGISLKGEIITNITQFSAFHYTPITSHNNSDYFQVYKTYEYGYTPPISMLASLEAMFLFQPKENSYTESECYFAITVDNEESKKFVDTEFFCDEISVEQMMQSIAVFYGIIENS